MTQHSLPTDEMSRFTLNTKIDQLEKEADQMRQRLQELESKISLMKERKLPEYFDRSQAIAFLENQPFRGRYSEELDRAFTWDDTPQGHDHWREIAEGHAQLTDSDKIQIQDWIITSYIDEFGT